LDPVRAAPLADAGVTPFRAVRRAGPWLGRGSGAAVIGVGGLGQFAVQYLKLLTRARVFAIDRSEQKLSEAKSLGADDVFLAQEAPPRCEAVLDFVGTNETLVLAMKLVKRGGILVEVGEAGGSLPFGFGKTDFEVTLTSSVWGSLRDLRAVLSFARRGELQWTVEEAALEGVNEALDRLGHEHVAGRAVLRPGMASAG